MRLNICMTAADFFKILPLPVMMRSLESGDFARGLPEPKDFASYPCIADTFRKLLQDKVIKIPAGQTEDDGTCICHRKGWIHADTDVSGRPTTTTRYVFPSFLHHSCLSWRLVPDSVEPPFSSVFEMSLATIQRFKPSNLLPAPRRMGSSPENPNEALYQAEFYQCLNDATSGSVGVSPEFVSAKYAVAAGRIDFFVTKRQWGIEITRDGLRLLEHNDCFLSLGAYGAWLQHGQMKDYILLDFRTTIPDSCHPSIRLIHFSSHPK
jgi:hypothetical protein